MQRIGERSRPEPTNPCRRSPRFQSRLLAMPFDIRMIVWDLLFDDVPVNLLNDIYKSSTWVVLKQPLISRVCRNVRTETLPMHYSRAALSINIARYGELARFQKFTRSMRPDMLRYLRKVTIYGRAVGGQVDIAFDFGSCKILDARWRQYQDTYSAQGRQVCATHWHLVGDIRIFQRGLEESDDSHQRSKATLEAVQAIIPSFFAMPIKNVMASPANKPVKLGAGASKACECMKLIEPKLKPK